MLSRNETRRRFHDCLVDNDMEPDLADYLSYLLVPPALYTPPGRDR
jgi:hypothetical protein